MKKLLLIGNPSVLGKNLENILKQNYDTDFISTVPKQIGSIPFNSYNALLLDFTLLHNYSLRIHNNCLVIHQGHNGTYGHISFKYFLCTDYPNYDCSHKLNYKYRRCIQYVQQILTEIKNVL